MNTIDASRPHCRQVIFAAGIAAIVCCSCAIARSARANPEFFDWPADRSFLPQQLKDQTDLIRTDADVSELDRFLSQKSRAATTFVSSSSTGPSAPAEMPPAATLERSRVPAAAAAADDAAPPAETAPIPEATCTTRSVDRASIDGISSTPESHHPQALPAAAGATLLSVGAGLILRRRLRT